MTTRDITGRQDNPRTQQPADERQQMQAGQRSSAGSRYNDWLANATGAAVDQAPDEAGDYYHRPHELRSSPQQGGWRDDSGTGRVQTSQARQFGGGQQSGYGGEYGGPQRGGYGGGSAGGAPSIYGGYPGRDSPRPSSDYGGDFQRDRYGNETYASRGAPAGSQDPHHHDPEYRQWRDEQMRKLDDEYRQWREERYQKFSTEFDEWRRNRTSQLPGGHAPAAPEASAGSVAGEEDPGAATVAKPSKP